MVTELIPKLAFRGLSDEDEEDPTVVNSPDLDEDEDDLDKDDDLAAPDMDDDADQVEQ